MYPVLFRIGPITIYTYGVFVFLGVVIAYWLAVNEVHREGIDKSVASDIFFWTIVCAFLGARLLYCVVEWRSFIHSPLKMIFSRTGFVFYGGILGGLAGFIFMVKRYQRDFFTMADSVALYIPLGHAIGRLGCFSYGCCYGRPTDSWIGMVFPPSSPAGALGVKVIPTQLISSFFLVVIFIILRVLRNHRRFKGQILLSYILLYSLFRFIIEFFRGDPRGFFWIFSTSQWISVVAFFIAVYLWRQWSGNFYSDLKG